MYLRFENDTPIYSFNETEQERLTKIIEELDKINTKVPNKIKILFQDSISIKILDAIFQYYYMDGVKVEYQEELEPYLENRLLIRLFVTMIFKSGYQISPDSTIQKYKFVYSSLNGKLTVLYSDGVMAQLNISEGPINIFGNIVHDKISFR